MHVDLRSADFRWEAVVTSPGGPGVCLAIAVHPGDLIEPRALYLIQRGYIRNGHVVTYASTQPSFFAVEE